MRTVDCDKVKLNGMPIEVRFTSKDLEAIQMSYDEYKYEVKRKLTYMMAEFMMENHLCEFTEMREPTQMANIYRCRAFLLTKDCVRELRETGQI